MLVHTFVSTRIGALLPRIEYNIELYSLGVDQTGLTFCVIRRDHFRKHVLPDYATFIRFDRINGVNLSDRSFLRSHEIDHIRRFITENYSAIENACAAFLQEFRTR